MKFVLFDEILEEHVCDALASAMQVLGHDVVRTGKVWHGHRLPNDAGDLLRIDDLVEKVLRSGADGLVNFRASSLRPSHLERLRRGGILTAVWLPDDPVLYSLCYREIVDRYDIVLNCGGRSVLTLYDEKGHRRGVNFPFWVDPSRFAVRDVEQGPIGRRWVFLGNLNGTVRSGRYARLMPLAEGLDIYGKCTSDPGGLCRGHIDSVDEVARLLAGYAVGINIPQFFTDYAGTPYSFDGLSNLGHFFLPSRVVQYAAAGLPVVSIGLDGESAHFPLAIPVADGAAALTVLRGRLAEPNVRAALGDAGRKEVVDHFSGSARARFLVALFEGVIDPAQLSLHEREFAYRWWCGAKWAAMK